MERRIMHSSPNLPASEQKYADLWARGKEQPRIGGGLPQCASDKTFLSLRKAR